MARSKRTRLATGIYEDAYGRSIVVKVHGVQHERRYARGSTIEDLRKYRRELREAKENAPTPRQRGILSAHMAAYLEGFPKGSTARQNAQILIDHWIDAGFGDRAPSDVTALGIKTQLAKWSTRFKPKTLNDLRRVLAAVYTAHNGKSGANPVRDVPRQRVTYDDPRGQDYSIIELVLAQVPDIGRAARDQARPDVSLTKLRLAVMAYTGLHQKEVGRLQPIDLREIDHKRVWIGGRKKGAGTEGGWHPLTSKGVAALKAFGKANAYGSISTSSMAKSWNRAVKKAKAIWATQHPDKPWPAPAGFRPYDLRHSYGTEVYRRTKDIRAAQRLMRHRTIQSTMRYTAAAVDPMAQAANDALDKAWSGASMVPADTGKGFQNTTPRSRKDQQPANRRIIRKT